MKFQLSIEIETNEIKTGFDVAQALRAVARRLQSLGLFVRKPKGEVFDQRGNVVGKWEVEE
jgi:hypothetical protein